MITGMHSYETLVQERTRCLAVVRLNRPDKRNALNPTLIRELDAVLRRLTALGVRDLESRPPTLEELFLRHYQVSEPVGAAR